MRKLFAFISVLFVLPLAAQDAGAVRQLQKLTQVYRYLNGLSLVTDMLDASNIQLSSELELTNARIGILYQYYLLKRTIGSL